MQYTKLNKNWLVFYFPEFNGRLMHLYHSKCAVSMGYSTGVKYAKCPKCKSKLSAWLLDAARNFIKVHQMADLDINI